MVGEHSLHRYGPQEEMRTLQVRLLLSVCTLGREHMRFQGVRPFVQRRREGMVPGTCLGARHSLLRDCRFRQCYGDVPKGM